MEVSRCKIHVDLTKDTETMNSAVRQVCKAVVKEWANVDEHVMQVSHITGGITNLLLKVAVSSNGISLESVTVRIFGPNTETVIDRQRELLAIHHLSTSGFGAELIGLFENDISTPKIAARIARELRNFHEADIPMSKEPQLWVDISKFMSEASTISFEDPKKQETFLSISFLELLEEIGELKRACDSLDAPIVFAHNDLLAGNVMFNYETDKMYLIDFEYSCYNYRGYDIANHFNEYAGFECDYSLYPSKDVQYFFFRHYLNGLSSKKVKVEITEAELSKLYIETSCYALASHIYWAVWAILQAKFSSIDFDYLDYFFLRFGEYKRKKQEFLSLMPSHQINE